MSTYESWSRMFGARRAALLGYSLFYGIIIFARSQTITNMSLPKSAYLTSPMTMWSTDVLGETATNNLTSTELTTYRSTETTTPEYFPLWPYWFYPVIEKVNISDTDEFFTSMAGFYTRICKHECGDSTEYEDYDKCPNGFDCDRAKCQCDPLCVLYGDCCPDAYLRYGYRDPVPNLECRYTTVKINDTGKGKMYYMVAGCPAEYQDEEVKTLCEVEHSEHFKIRHGPVSSMSTLVTYKNEYCAQCKGINDTVRWPVSFECFGYSDVHFSETMEDAINEIITNPSCSIKFELPAFINIHPHRCHYENLITTCSDRQRGEKHFPYLEKACHSYTGVFISYGESYRNVFCFMCQGWGPPSWFFCADSPYSQPIPLTALLDFYQVSIPSKDNGTISCKPGEVADEVKNICRKIKCPLGKFRTGDVCIPFFEMVSGLAFKQAFKLKPRSRLIVKSSFRKYNYKTNLDILQNFTEISFNLRVNFDPFYLLVNMSETITGSNLEIHYFLIYFNALQMGAFDRDALEKELLKLLMQRTYIIIEGHSVEFSPFTDDETANIQMDGRGKPYTIFFNFSHGIFEIKEYITSIEYSPFPAATDRAFQGHFVRISDILVCDQVHLQPDEYQYDNLTDTVIIDYLNNATLNNQHYALIKSGNRLRICVELFKSLVSVTNNLAFSGGQNLPIYNAVLGWLSLVCICLSLLCLAFSFVTYCLFSILRTVPGINNMLLIFSLFWAQCLFQFGANATNTKWLCQALGVCIHYAWLSTFCFMNVCCFHMYKIFRNVLQSLSNTKKVLILYVIYALVVPLLIIGATIIAHVVLTDFRSIGYGEVLCFLSSPLAIGLTFALPVGLTVICNTTMFCITLHSIMNTSKVESTAGNKHNLFTYIKLSTVTGMTWIFGFLAEFTGLVPLSYIFVLFNSGQGLLLFLSFVFNKRVIRMYAELLGKGSDAPSQMQRAKRVTAKTTTTSQGSSDAKDASVKVVSYN